MTRQAFAGACSFPANSPSLFSISPTICSTARL
jgi:hypothetical protein